MSIRIRDEDNTDHVVRKLQEIGKYGIEVGLFGADDSFMVMIGSVNEFGANIQAKGEFLTIPTKAAAGRAPSDFGKELFRPKGKNILAINKGGQLEVMFILKKSVIIPERSFLRSTFDEKNREWQEFARSMISKVINNTMTVDEFYEQWGSLVVGDIQQKITSIRNPGNAPLTVANKGSSNPLIDTGAMRQAVTYRVVRA